MIDLRGRDFYYLRHSKLSLWVTPVSTLVFFGITWLVSLLLPVSPVVYWIIAITLGLAWIGDLINALYLRKRIRTGEDHEKVSDVVKSA